MRDYKVVKEFLSEPKIQEYLNDEEMNELFNHWIDFSGYNYNLLIEFFELECGINPLDYMDYVPSGYFYHHNAKQLHIPEGIRNIYPDCIYGCKNLETIYLPNSITFLQTDAIANCPNLRYIAYEGTKEDFYNIQLEDFTGDRIVTIQCDDGDIEWNNEDL